MQQAMSVLTSQTSQEWYTPPHVVEWVREILGGIELDPASCYVANQTIQADRFYDLETNGFTKPWHARTLFLNPPYNDTQRWLDKLAFNYGEGRLQQAIALVNSAPGYNWFEIAWRSNTVCMLRERVWFLQADGTTVGAAKKGQCLIYFGADDSDFARVLKPFGRVLRP